MTQVHYVVHHDKQIVAVHQASLAFAAGADGVFMIPWGGRATTLNVLASAKKVKEDYPDKFVGVNLLGANLSKEIAMADACGLDGVWFDWSDVTSKGVGASAEEAARTAKNLKRPFKVFAGVAFKYQDVERDPPAAARFAAMCDFIPCTSGSGTGSPPTVEKLESMSKACSGTLAVASGITPENVKPFLPHLAHILVATGVNDESDSLVPKRLERLCRFAHA